MMVDFNDVCTRRPLHPDVTLTAASMHKHDAIQCCMYSLIPVASALEHAKSCLDVELRPNRRHRAASATIASSGAAIAEYEGVELFDVFELGVAVEQQGGVVGGGLYQHANVINAPFGSGCMIIGESPA
jgi:hypothetical protein